ncbi:hypothetical protein Golax_019627 [Gossypium laxum]|uniref:Uncharacterized protein n=1 Tax=Gossypium laxum TaxID=34288 RepID=A0A7J8Z775_9ROSI|nr:hypothetical protein [Gossypium laxum]
MKVISIEEAKDLERLTRRFKKFESNSNVPKSKSKGIVIKEEVEKDKMKGVKWNECQG